MEGVFCNCCLRSLKGECDYSAYPINGGSCWLCKNCYCFVINERSRATADLEEQVRELHQVVQVLENKLWGEDP